MSPWEFFIIKANSFNELLDILCKFLNSDDYIKEVDGQEFVVETRAKVDIIDGYKIEIYPNEHLPPHFHVVKNQCKLASYRIDNCEKLKGDLPPNVEKKLKFFFKHSKSKLFTFWQETRPSTT